MSIAAGLFALFFSFFPFLGGGTFAAPRPSTLQRQTSEAHGGIIDAPKTTDSHGGVIDSPVVTGASLSDR